MEKRLTNKESLSIINEMISQARNNFQKDSALPSIIAGYCVAGVAILNFILLFVMPHPEYSFHVWWLMVPMWVVIKIANRKQEQKTLMKTHIDNIVGKMWQAYGYSIIISLLSIFGLTFALDSWLLPALITPTLFMLTGLVQYITGTAFRFRPYIYGGIIFWVGALLAVAVYFTNASAFQFIILALCMILGFVIPGYKANKKGE